MEGELAELTAAWRSAEELAQISDSLLLPPEVEEQMAELKEKNRSDGFE